MTEAVFGTPAEILSVRPSNRVACWTTGTGPGRTGTRPTDSTCNRMSLRRRVVNEPWRMASY